MMFPITSVLLKGGLARQPLGERNGKSSAKGNVENLHLIIILEISYPLEKKKIVLTVNQRRSEPQPGAPARSTNHGTPYTLERAISRRDGQIVEPLYSNAYNIRTCQI